MNRTELIQRFCAMVNNGLAQGEENGKVAYEQLMAKVSTLNEKSLLEQLYHNYYRALEPDTFYNIPITEPDERFEQCYELLRLTFNEDELGPREVYLKGFRLLKKAPDAPLPVRIGRFWQALGPQQYHASGQLQSFGFDPLVLTESVMSEINGTYMSMEGSQRTHESLAAIGHIATRSHFRRGHGHGTAVLKAFEQEVEMFARERGDKLQLIVLESQADARGFWSKRGYRWPVGSYYVQPPLAFDPITGEPLYDEVPEYLMVKIWNEPEATQIDSQLLTDAVHTMYQNWYLRGTATYEPEAAKRAIDYVFGKDFAAFVASLPPGGEPVPLQEPASF